MTVSGNSVQLIDAREFADDNDEDGWEDGGRWPLWLLFDEAMGWAHECLCLREGDDDRINGTTAFNFKCRSPSLLPSSSAFDQGLLTVSGNSVQLTDASEFAAADNNDGWEDGGRWPS